MGHWAVILISILFSAFFSGMEIAYIATNKLLLELEKKKETFSSSILKIFFRNPDQYIATMLVGNNIALVIYGIKMALVLEPFIEQNIVDNEWGILFIQTVASTLIILVTAEFLPKTVFRLHANSSLKAMVVPLLICYLALYPIAALSSYLSRRLLSALKIKMIDEEEQPVFGKIDLDNFVQESMIDVASAEIPEHDVKIFQNALDFSSVRLKNCIIPRTEVEAVDIDASIQEVTQRFIETGYSKILVYKDNIDHIVGYLHSSELFKNPKDLRSRINTLPIVPETMPASRLMGMFMQDKKSIAVVVDEFGGTSGIVTLEDIMEEIFGEIEDEHDTRDQMANKVGDHEYLLAGRVEVDFINEEFELNLPVSEEYETVAGLILSYHKNLPQVNEEIIVEGFNFTVLKVSQTRIDLVRLVVNF